MKKLLITSFVISLSLLNTAKAINGSFTIYPTNTTEKWVNLEIQQGESKNQSITLVNTTNQKITLNLEFKNTTGTRENIKIDESNKNFLRSWLSHPNSVTLNPNEKKIIETNITVPDNIETGNYQGVLLASYSQTTSDLLTINTKIGTRYYIKIKSRSELQNNIFNISKTNLQTTLILISTIGLIYGLKKTKSAELTSKLWNKILSKN